MAATSLADAIAELRIRTFADLNAVHDHYFHTRRLWIILRQEVRNGRKLTLRNPLTKTTTRQDGLSKLSVQYVNNYLAPFTFQQIVVHFESFFFDLLRLWLRTYPRSLSAKVLRFGDFLEMPDREAVIDAVIAHELNEVQYKGVSEWFGYLARLVSLEPPSPDELGRLAEMKASRDLLVHNRGIVNATYLRKAGTHVRYRDQERLRVLEPYLNECWELAKSIVDRLCQDVMMKANG